MTNSRTPQSAIAAGIVLMRLDDERAQAEHRVTEQVAEVLRLGGSWATVGAALGLSRQGAQQRYRLAVAALAGSQALVRKGEGPA